MRRPVILVDTAQASLADESALAAALDGLEHEPRVPDHPLPLQPGAMFTADKASIGRRPLEMESGWRLGDTDRFPILLPDHPDLQQIGSPCTTRHRITRIWGILRTSGCRAASSQQPIAVVRVSLRSAPTGMSRAMNASRQRYGTSRLVARSSVCASRCILYPFGLRA